MSKRILEVNNLTTSFFTGDGVVTAVDGVSFSIDEGETLAIVGESGCGKSVTSLSVMGLIPWPPGKILNGQVLLDGEDLLSKPEEEMQKVRGNKISMIFQEPMTSLNPVLNVGFQIMEALQLHQGLSAAEARERAIEMLRLVGIPEPERRIDEYPHQMSGGMRQRVMIGMALACNPRLLIADEPTTALDVTIQAQILDLMHRLQREMGTAILLITHDMGVVAEMAERVIVMYAGRFVEEGGVESIFDAPLHPYTAGLLNSIPRVDVSTKRLHVIPGTVPSPSELPSGCRFHPRCAQARQRCKNEEPPLFDIGQKRKVRCWLCTERASAEEGVL
ncbi:MAG TPA: ABC transporter ATP-binding protein [Firmicutes bacterium]|nr:ABC transporter ATP-binding protein [Candidatus Fermentithermobacillaceae bacterium]